MATRIQGNTPPSSSPFLNEIQTQLLRHTSYNERKGPVWINSQNRTCNDHCCILLLVLRNLTWGEIRLAYNLVVPAVFRRKQTEFGIVPWLSTVYDVTEQFKTMLMPTKTLKNTLTLRNFAELAIKTYDNRDDNKETWYMHAPQTLSRGRRMLAAFPSPLTLLPLPWLRFTRPKQHEKLAEAQPLLWREMEV